MGEGVDVGRVTVITNGNAFAAHALAPLMSRAGRSGIRLQIIVTSGLRKQRGNRFVEALSLLRRWGVRYFSYKLMTYLVPWLAEHSGRGPRTVSALAASHGLNVLHARNVNVRRVRARIEAFAPDLILSVSCPYRIRSSVLGLARIGCLNLHSSLLPAYAGVCTYIHVLAAGEPRTGITLHEMVEEFDAGKIVAQEAMEIAPRTSVCALFRGLCLIAGPMVAERIGDILDCGTVMGEDQDADARHYCGEPSREDIDALRRHGFVLVTRDDLRSFWCHAPGESSA